MKMIELWQIRSVVMRADGERDGATLVVNADEIRHLSKPGDPSGDTLVTLRSGEQFMVSDSIRTIMAKMGVD